MRTTLLIAAVTFVGCGVGVAEDAAGVDPSAEATANLEESNGLDYNGLGSNGLSSNGLSSNGLGSNGLSSNGLSSNGLTVYTYGTGSASINAWFDQNPNLNVLVLKYYAKCAMPSGTKLAYTRNGVKYAWPGVFGLAPNLKKGLAMTTAEQRWVSACLLAHVNANAKSLKLSFRSPNSPSLASTSTEKTSYPTAEGAFFGNLFLATPEKFVCNTVDTTNWNGSNGRECTTGNAVCGMTLTGQCNTRCTWGADYSNGFTSCTDPSGVARTEVVSTYFKPFCGDGYCSAGEERGCEPDCGYYLCPGCVMP